MKVIEITTQQAGVLYEILKNIVSLHSRLLTPEQAQLLRELESALQDAELYSLPSGRWIYGDG